MTSACWKATISHPCSLVKYLSLKLIRPSWLDHKLDSEHHAESSITKKEHFIQPIGSKACRTNPLKGSPINHRLFLTISVLKYYIY